MMAASMEPNMAYGNHGRKDNHGVDTNDHVTNHGDESEMVSSYNYIRTILYTSLFFHVTCRKYFMLT